MKQKETKQEREERFDEIARENTQALIRTDLLLD